jgi:LacI family transcriptional regulator
MHNADMRNGSRAPRRQADAGSRLGGTAATLHDVAREAGVSVATASRALNGSTRTVRQENVSRVLRAAAALEYRPHLSAQATARGSTTTAALVVSDVGDPYFSAIAAGVSQAAEAAGLIVTMAVSDRSPDRELQIVRTLRGQRPRAIIVAGSRIDGAGTREALGEELLAHQQAGGSVVMISQHDLPFTTVSIDNSGGARQLARALVEQGYRQFAVIRAADRLRTSHDRYAGFVTGLGEAGIDLDDRFVVTADFTRAGGYAAAGELVRRGIGGTALVFAVTDVMAIGAMTALRDAGLVPGGDIAVAGFDDIDAAVDLTPALTTVAIPLRKVGRTAMKLALRESATPDLVRIPTKVILRNSTPPCPNPNT